MRKYTFIFSCTDNGGGHPGFVVKAENKQEAIKKGMAFAKKHLRVMSVGIGSAK